MCLTSMRTTLSQTTSPPLQLLTTAAEAELAASPPQPLVRTFSLHATVAAEDHGPDLQNILRLQYDNAKVTINLRLTSNLQNTLQ